MKDLNFNFKKPKKMIMTFNSGCCRIHDESHEDERDLIWALKPDTIKKIEEGKNSKKQLDEVGERKKTNPDQILQALLKVPPLGREKLRKKKEVNEEPMKCDGCGGTETRYFLKNCEDCCGVPCWHHDCKTTKNYCCDCWNKIKTRKKKI